MSRGLFGGMFDFNGDGDPDVFEQAAEFMFFQQLMKEEENDELDDDDGCW